MYTEKQIIRYINYYIKVATKIYQPERGYNILSK